MFLLDENNSKPHPIHNRYLINKCGLVIDSFNGLILSQNKTYGYYCVNLEVGRIPTGKNRKVVAEKGFKYISDRGVYRRFYVHRLVAETWIENVDLDKEFVNHKDGNKINNHVDNLEWCTHSENVNHAVSNGLFRFSTPCKVRDFETGEVTHFHSLADAKRFMGLPINVRTIELFPKTFGVLLRNRFEFKFECDETPWFYENRTQKVRGRYIAVLKHENGEEEEFFNVTEVIKKYNLPTHLYKLNMWDVLRYYKIHNEPKCEYTVTSSNQVDKFINDREYYRKKRYNIWCYDLELDEEIIFDDLREFANKYDISNKTLKYWLERETPIKGRWFIRYQSDEKGIENIKKLIQQEWGDLTHLTAGTDIKV